MKKYLLVAALVAIIIACVAVIEGELTRMRTLPTGPPDWVMQQPEEKIDAKTLELVTKTKAEWAKIPQHLGRWKNPTTGEFTLADVMICASCGAKIPMPPLAGADRGRRMEIIKNYMCPKCKKHAFPKSYWMHAP